MTMMKISLRVAGALLLLGGGVSSQAAEAFPILVDAANEAVVNPPVVIRADRQAALAQFEAYDDDEDGLLSDEEAEDLPGVEESVYGADEFAAIDTDASGEIDFQEFAVYLSSGRAEIVPLVSTDTEVEEIGEDDPGEIDAEDVEDLDGTGLADVDEDL